MPTLRRTTVAVLAVLVVSTATACREDDPPVAPDSARTSLWRRAGDSVVLVQAMEMREATMRTPSANPPERVTLSKATERRLRAAIAQDTLARRVETLLASTDTTSDLMRAMPTGAIAMPYDSLRRRTGWAVVHPAVRDTQLTTSVMIDDKTRMVMTQYQVSDGARQRLVLSVARSTGRAGTPTIVVMEPGANSPLARGPGLPPVSTSRPAPTP